MSTLLTDIIIHFIEAMIISYFIYQYCHIKPSLYKMTLFSILYSFNEIMTDYFFVYNYLFILISIFLIYAMIDALKQHNDKLNSLFIAVFYELIISVCNNLSIIRMLFVSSRNINNNIIQYSNSYYLIALLSKILLFLILKIINEKCLNHYLVIKRNYMIMVSIYSIINLFINCYISQMYYSQTFVVSHIYLILLLNLFTTIFIIVIIIYINNNLNISKEQELEIIKLKSIEEKYISIKTQKERNEEIKHDLEYFIKIVNNDELTKLLEKDIEKIKEQDITIYSQNKIINTLLTELVEIADKYHQKILYNINIGNHEITLDMYNNILSKFNEICAYNDSDTIEINVSFTNHYFILEAIIEPKNTFTFDRSYYIIDNTINDMQSIKYIVKI